MTENYTTKRVAIVLVSVAAIYLVNLIFSHSVGFAAPLADAATGIGVGILSHKYWS